MGICPQLIEFIDRITDTLTKEVVRKVKNWWGYGIGKISSGLRQRSKEKPNYRYPFGFIICQRQASRIISGKPRLAFQPSSRAALFGSA